jgi:hypothetical protein
MSEHIVPVRIYITIFLALLLGTGLTVAAAFYDFPWKLNAVVALTFSDYNTRRWDTGRTAQLYSPGWSDVSRTSIRRLHDGQFKRMVASEVLIGAPQKGQTPSTSL